MSRWLVVMALMSGCGFGLSGPDPQQPREQMPKCDTGKGAVVVDGLMATVASVVALALVANDEPAGALIPLGIGAAYIGGAVHGSRAVDSCRKAIDDWGTMMAARDQLDRRGPPGDDDEAELPHPRVKAPPPQPAQMADVPAEYEEQVQPVQPSQQVPPAQTAPPQQPSQQAPPQQPPPPQPAKQQPKQQKPRPKQPPPSDDDWTDFWREVQ